MLTGTKRFVSSVVVILMATVAVGGDDAAPTRPDARAKINPGMQRGRIALRNL